MPDSAPPPATAHPPPTKALAAPLVIGVTGHRNLAAAEVAGLGARVRDFLIGLRHDFPGLPLLLVSSLAEGGDQLVAEEALALGARLLAPLPLPRDLYACDFVDPDARRRFHALCARAEVIELPLLPGTTRASVAVAGAARDRQYAQAGIYTANHSHILLALWDGHPGGRLGGTAQTVRFHMDGIPPDADGGPDVHRVFLDTGDESLLYHIACSRDTGVDGISPPASPLQPLAACWVTDQGRSPGAAGMPAEFRRMFRRMEQFNADAARRGCSFAPALPADGDCITTGADRPAPSGLFAAADALATHFQQQVLRVLRGLYTLAAIMGVAFVYFQDTPPGLPGQMGTIYVFVSLFASGALLASIAKRREWHRKYIDYRALAEGLRVQGYWQRAGVDADGSGAFAFNNFMQKQDVELGWIRHVLRTAGLGAPRVPSGDIAGVVAEWIGEPGGDGQLGYYARTAAHRRRTRRRYETVARILLGGAVAASVAIAVFNRWLDEDQITWLVALMGVLTVIAAAREAYAFHKADKELLNQYRYMSAIFASARRQLDVTRDPALQRAILRALGDAALAEHAEWALLHRQRPLEAAKM